MEYKNSFYTPDNNIPDIGQSFKVTFARFPDHFIGVIVAIDNNPQNSDRQYKVHQSKRTAYDVLGNPYYLPFDTIEVESNWFNNELTGRKIEIIKH